MKFDYAHYMLTLGKNPEESSPAMEVYKRRLLEIFDMNRTRILALKNKPPPPVADPDDWSSSVQLTKSIKRRRHIPQTSERVLDATELLDDYYLNLLDWGSNNVISIALRNIVYLWDASSGNASELVWVGDEKDL